MVRTEGAAGYGAFPQAVVAALAVAQIEGFIEQGFVWAGLHGVDDGSVAVVCVVAFSAATRVVGGKAEGDGSVGVLCDLGDADVHQFASVGVFVVCKGARIGGVGQLVVGRLRIDVGCHVCLQRVEEGLPCGFVGSLVFRCGVFVVVVFSVCGDYSAARMVVEGVLGVSVVGVDKVVEPDVGIVVYMGDEQPPTWQGCIEACGLTVFEQIVFVAVPFVVNDVGIF